MVINYISSLPQLPKIAFVPIFLFLIQYFWAFLPTYMPKIPTLEIT